MSAVFPGTGHRYLVDFKAFRVEPNSSRGSTPRAGFFRFML